MNQSTQDLGIPAVIARKLWLVRQRKLWIHVASACVTALAVLLAAMGVAMLIDWLATLYDSRWRVVLTVTAIAAAGATALGWLVIARRRLLELARIAGDVDRQIPQLEERWTTMTRLGSYAADPKVVHPAMLRRVSSEAVRWEPRVEPEQVAPVSVLLRAMVGLTAVTAVLAVAVVLNSHQTLVLAQRFWLPASSIYATQLVDLPGDVVIGRGEPLVLGAAVQGTPVDRATLFLRPEGELPQTIRMVGQGSDPIEFSHRLRAVETPFAYRFRAGDGQSDWHSVAVADRPEIKDLKLRVTPPEYTRREAKSFNKLPPRISTIQRSTLELAIRAKSLVESVQLRLDSGEHVKMTAEDDGWYRWRMTLEEGFAFEPVLTESHGLTNRRAPKCLVNVYLDRPPVVKILTPDDQMAVRPDDTVQITFSASDDVGIGSAELVVYNESPGSRDDEPIAAIPIPLGDKQGERAVQQSVELDLARFAAKNGGEISYEIRVREVRGEPSQSGAASASTMAAASPMSSPQAPPSQSAEADAQDQASPEPAGGNRDGGPAAPITSQASESSSPAAPSVPGPSSESSPPAASVAAAPPRSAGQMEQRSAARADQPQRTAARTSPPGTSTSNTSSSDASSANASSASAGSPPERPSAAGGESTPNASSPKTASVASNDAPTDSASGAVQGQPSPRGASEPKEPSSPASDSQIASDAPTSASQPPAAREATSGRQGLSTDAMSEQKSIQQPESDRERSADASSEMAKNVAPAAGSQAESPKSPPEANENVAAGPRDAGSPSSPGNQATGRSSVPQNGSQSQSDSMARRQLDVGEPASNTSQRMRLKIDELAGSFSGQQRGKLELAIAPDLEALDKALEKAQQSARGILDQLEADSEWRTTHDLEVTSAERSTVEARERIGKLEQRTKGTPYAFIGLQVADIGLAHVEPARGNFWKALQSDGDDRAGSVRDGWQHLVRARELVAELRGQFERARRELQLAEAMEKVKKMYQVYIENTQALLQMEENDPGRYNRKLVEFKLDDEYLKRLQEVLEMRRDLQAELARILGDDPRLLRRFMDSLRSRSNNMREELADLVADQEDLNREVRAWSAVSEVDRPRMARILMLRQLQDSAKISASAGELQSRYQAWLPLDRESKDADLAAATKKVQEVATAASELSASTQQFVAESQRVTLADSESAPDENAQEEAKESLAPILADAQKLYERFGELEVALRQIAAREEGAEAALFAANRLVDTRRLIADTSAWVRQMRAHEAGNYTGAAEVDQYRLAMQTDQLAGKLGTIEQSLAVVMQRNDGTLPEAIAAKARELLATLDKQASPNQLAAVYSLHGNQLPRATERQKSAGEALGKAAAQYDELMRAVIEELDKLPVQDPIADLLDDPTLDELLAELEQELPIRDLLGIPNRPSNLRVVNDWLRPGAGGNGGGRWMMNQVRQDQQRMRQRLEDAYRRTLARALKEEKDLSKVEIPKAARSDWNRLVSRLGDDLRQGRDKAPPEQYRRAIEQYFAQISRAVAEDEKRAP